MHREQQHPTTPLTPPQQPATPPCPPAPTVRVSQYGGLCLKTGTRAGLGWSGIFFGGWRYA